MDNEIILVFEETTRKFRAAVLAFNEEQLNTIPFENSWTAAQVADHVLRSQARFPQLLAGKTEAANRQPEEKKEMIGKAFLDFNTKMKSPEFILPTNEPQNKEALIKRIDDKSGAIKTAMQSNDLTKICLDFELPGAGKFTGLEWCWFAIDHTIRHTRQIENILIAIGNGGTN